MVHLKEKRTWKYVKALIQHLKRKGPFWYSREPGFYDELADVLIPMNRESVDGLLQIYQLTTVWPQELYQGFPRFSRLKSDGDELIRGQPLRHSLYTMYAENESQLRHEPIGAYVNQAKIAAWAVPMEMAYGSAKSVEFLNSLEVCRINDIFKVPVLQAFINYKWRQARRFLFAEATLHLCFLLSFNVVAVSPSARHSLLACGLTSIFILVFAIRELLQLLSLRCHYFLDPWNYPDLGMLLFTLLALFPPPGVGHEGESWLFVIAVLLVWTRLLSYFRLWGRTRHLIRAITETISDMVPFLCVLLVLVLSFASAWVTCFPEYELGQLTYGELFFQGY